MRYYNKKIFTLEIMHVSSVISSVYVVSKLIRVNKKSCQKLYAPLTNRTMSYEKFV